jgi:uncharacterized Zn-binding protein involved in type VI secretion
MPAAARKGDSGTVHCSGFVIAQGSPDVNINGRPAARVSDPSTSHLLPRRRRRCGTHTSTISSGSGTVFINGRPAARVGDPFSGCTRVAQGSPNVIIG